MRFWIITSLLLTVTLTCFITPKANAQGSVTAADIRAKREAFLKSIETKPEDIHFSIDRSQIANPKFNALVREALQSTEKNRPRNFNFTRLREHYAQTRQYDPLGIDTKDELLELAFSIQNDPDPFKVEEALLEYSELIKKHLAHMDIVLLALSFAKDDPKKFGSPKFYNWIFYGLLDSVLNFGDGSSFQTAYAIVTPTEETFLLRHFKLTPKNTEFITTPSHYYNVHRFIDKDTGRDKDFFVNVTYPRAKVAVLQKRRSVDLDIQR